MFEGVRGRFLERELLFKHVSLKVGGAADYWVEPEDAEDLKRILSICRERGKSFYVLGLGSNVLPPDEGFRGVVIRLVSAYFQEVRVEGHRVKARAGVPNTQFIQSACRHGLWACEFLYGIPGCIGGAIAMNAGSHGQSIDQILEGVTVLLPSGEIKNFERNELQFSYRSLALNGMIILEAVFLLKDSEESIILKTLDSYRKHRLDTQDLSHASAGCMFKNPEGLAMSSGKLIEDAGLKGKRIGGAQVSTKHANFIVNLGEATSSDIYQLIRHVQSIVKEKYDVCLETEVRKLSMEEMAYAKRA